MLCRDGKQSVRHFMKQRLVELFLSSSTSEVLADGDLLPSEVTPSQTGSCTVELEGPSLLNESMFCHQTYRFGACSHQIHNFRVSAIPEFSKNNFNILIPNRKKR
jgi:hypothetical protein